MCDFNCFVLYICQFLNRRCAKESGKAETWTVVDSLRCLTGETRGHATGNICMECRWALKKLTYGENTTANTINTENTNSNIF